MLTPAQRRSQARLAALVLWSRTPDRLARTQPARDAFMRRFEDQVDPQRVHPPEVRAKMAEAAKRAYFVQLARRRRPRARKAAGDGTT